MKNKDYNEYDNPSSQMRVNTKLLKHIMIVTDWCMKNETPVLIKASAKELSERTNKYCQDHFKKVYEEIDNINQTNLERFQK